MTIKSSAVCLREVETEKVENKKGISNDGNISPENILYMLSPPHSFVFVHQSHPSLAREELREAVLGDMS